MEKEREQLLELMSATSEDRWAAGWLVGLDELLYHERGVWEILGRKVGWPLGYRAEGGWREWFEAGKYYEDRKVAHSK